MKITFKYGDSVTAIPSRPLSEHICDAGRDELAVFLTLALDPLASAEEICEKLGITHDAFMSAVSFWRGAGAITVSLEDGEKLPSSKKRSAKAESKPSAIEPEKQPAKPIAQPSSIPHYTTAQIAGFLEASDKLRQYVENCQQILGKIFNTGEAAMLIGIVEYLGVDTEYVALLCAYCVSHGKKSVRYIEKMALGLYDEGITKYAELEDHLRRLGKSEDMQPEIRKMFGIGERAFTPKEKKFIESWCVGMGYGMDMIAHAYEITVNNTGKAALPYANSILENWYQAGYKTLSDVTAAEEEYRKTKKSGDASFDTDDFFDAALKRSYGESS